MPMEILSTQMTISKLLNRVLLKLLRICQMFVQECFSISKLEQTSLEELFWNYETMFAPELPKISVNYVFTQKDTDTVIQNFIESSRISCYKEVILRRVMEQAVKVFTAISLMMRILI